AGERPLRVTVESLALADANEALVRLRTGRLRGAAVLIPGGGNGGRMSALFVDRREAGRRLAPKLARFAGRPELIVLGLPRGGIPVALGVASALRARLDAFVVRKLGAPGREELAMGAVASGGVRVVN